MCERFAISITSKVLLDTFGVVEHPDALLQGDVRPGQQIPVLRQNADGQNCFHYLHWGLIPSWTKERDIGSKMTNVRSETVMETQASRQAVRYRRCLILTSGFFGSKREGAEKRSYYCYLRASSLMVLAGLWECWKSQDGTAVESCTILTTTSNRLVGNFSGRMPVILHPDEYQTWLDRKNIEIDTLVPLFHPYPSDLMEMRPACSLVNGLAKEYGSLIDPMPATAPPCQQEGSAYQERVSKVARSGYAGTSQPAAY